MRKESRHMHSYKIRDQDLVSIVIPYGSVCSFQALNPQWIKYSIYCWMGEPEYLHLVFKDLGLNNFFTY